MKADYTALIGAEISLRQRVGCVFSQCLNDNSLGCTPGAPGPRVGSPTGVEGPPGNRQTGVEEWRAVSRVLRSMGSPGRVARAVVDDLVTTFFPADCRACGGPLLRAGSPSLCDECLNQLREQSAALCVRCGEALDVDGLRFAGQYPAEGLLCSPCRVVPPEFERAVAYGVYEDELRQMIHLLKYEGVRGVAKPLGRLLARVIERLQIDSASELTVVAVPLFAPKQRRRGYNQTVLLADAAIAELRRTKPHWKLMAAHTVLKRVKETESQFGLTAAGRRRNLRGAFEVVDPAAVSGREVLLLDDIYTTGATARECSRLLRRAGASKVWVATLARAQKEMVAMWSSRDGT